MKELEQVYVVKMYPENINYYIVDAMFFIRTILSNLSSKFGGIESTNFDIVCYKYTNSASIKDQKKRRRRINTSNLNITGQSQRRSNDFNFAPLSKLFKVKTSFNIPQQKWKFSSYTHIRI